MLDNDIYHAHLVVDKDGVKKHHPAGRLLVHDGRLYHLENYHGLLDHIPEGVIDDYTMAKMASPPPGLRLASRSQIRAGHHLDMLPEADLQPLPAPAPDAALQAAAKRPSVWHYTRAGHDAPHILEATNGKFSLDGNPLQDHEVSTILENVKNKVARIRYPKASLQDAVAKHEAVFASLRKAMDTEAALKYVEGLGSGPEHEEAVKSLHHAIFTDPMTGLGNKVAYTKWSSQERPGIHFAIDANNFKGVNDTYGHDAGDKAIAAYGQAIRESVEEAAPPGPQGGSAHRIGGDEFQAHFHTPEQAARFQRGLRSRLEAMPLVGGTHRMSLSVGMANDPHMADAALYEAKRQKFTPSGMHAPHTVPHLLSHSLVPGHEGPMSHDPPSPPTLAPASQTQT